MSASCVHVRGAPVRFGLWAALAVCGAGAGRGSGQPADLPEPVRARPGFDRTDDRPARGTEDPGAPGLAETHGSPPQDGSAAGGDAGDPSAQSDLAAFGTHPLSPEEEARVVEWVRRLGSVDFRERGQASQALEALGPAAFATLREAYRRSDDLEVRLRIRQAVENAHVRHQFRTQSGFLGIRFQASPGSIHPRVPAGQGAAMVLSVVPGSAAARAGLEPGDLIIALDGLPLEPPSQANPRADQFRDMIRTTAPGQVRTLDVIRGDQVIQQDVAIGQKRSEDFTEDELTEFGAAFAEFWTREFAIEPDGRPSGRVRAEDAPAREPEFVPVYGDE